MQALVPKAAFSKSWAACMLITKLSLLCFTTAYFQGPTDDIEPKSSAEAMADAACLVFFCMSVLNGTKWPFSSVKFCERNQVVSLFILALLGGQQLTSEAGATLGTRRFPYSKIFKDLRSRESNDRPFSFARETPPSASVLHTIRLRGGGDGSVLHDKVVHNIKGVEVRAKSTKLPDGSCSCLFTYDGGDALTLQVRLALPPRPSPPIPAPHPPRLPRERSGGSPPSPSTSGSTPPCSATAAPTPSTPQVPPRPRRPRRPGGAAAPPAPRHALPQYAARKPLSLPPPTLLPPPTPPPPRLRVGLTRAAAGSASYKDTSVRTPFARLPPRPPFPRLPPLPGSRSRQRAP
jgi:hypothetical protein